MREERAALEGLNGSRSSEQTVGRIQTLTRRMGRLGALAKRAGLMGFGLATIGSSETVQDVLGSGIEEAYGLE